MYTMLKNRGFDDQHIIQCQYDDIVQSASNPFKGQIFHTLDHVNVYPGASTIDYTGKKVTAQQFYDILTTLPSTSEDYVYIYYDNHGGPGILGVPDGVSGGTITADELSAAFNTMATKKNYKYIFFGIEACYSGSVAEVFTAPNMATITAANNQESSYAAVMDSKVGTYLTNEFSNYWMQYMDNHADKTIGDIYQTVKSQTSGSHVCFYGDESMKSLKLSLFLGTPNVVTPHNEVKEIEIVPTYLATKSTLKLFSESADASVAAEAKVALQALIASQDKFRMTLTAISKQLEPENQNALYEPCGKITKEYFEVLRYFTSKYGMVNGDDLPYFSVFVNLCNKHSVASIKAAIDAIC
jgi:legumain